MQLDFASREITIKLVYYGPALSGKTTNLQAIHQLSSPDTRGRLMTLDTRDDRTLFFDMLPLTFKGAGALALRLKLFTVPGQVIHASTRRLVLQGADGVAFIADSQTSETRANAAAFVDLKDNLKANGLDIGELPLIIQFNKQDLPNARPIEELRRQAEHGKEPVYTAIATETKGVLESFVGLLHRTMHSLNRTNDLWGKFGVDPELFVNEVLERFGDPRSVREILAEALVDRSTGGG